MKKIILTVVLTITLISPVYSQGQGTLQQTTIKKVSQHLKLMLSPFFYEIPVKKIQEETTIIAGVVTVEAQTEVDFDFDFGWNKWTDCPYIAWDFQCNNQKKHIRINMNQVLLPDGLKRKIIFISSYQYVEGWAEETASWSLVIDREQGQEVVTDSWGSAYASNLNFKLSKEAHRRALDILEFAIEKTGFDPWVKTKIIK